MQSNFFWTSICLTAVLLAPGCGDETGNSNGDPQVVGSDTTNAGSDTTSGGGEDSGGACADGSAPPCGDTQSGRDTDMQSGRDTGSEESCSDGNTRPCGKSEGACSKGTETCRNGEWSDCQGGTLPEDETCDGEDNDCDGEIDENLRRSCYSGDSDEPGTGVCQKGVQECSAGEWGECEGEVTPSEETCDNKDNDCDGTADEPTQEATATCNADCECFSGVCTDQGVCAHRIFATDVGYTGGFGSLADADQKCDDRAAQAGISGNWAAVISNNNTDAKARIRVASEIYTTAGDKVADGAGDLWDGSIQNPIRSNASGNPTSTLVAWTGTNSDGTAASANCENWTASSGSAAQIGSVKRTGNGWISIGTGLNCDKNNALYCIDGQ